MPSYKIHSIKNNKKLSFIIDGRSLEEVKNNLSADGFIVVTIQPLEEDGQLPLFSFEAIKEDNTLIEGKVDAKDIFSAYEVLVNDYQYNVLKLYPTHLTDPQEQEMVFNNILQIYPQKSKIENIKQENSETRGKTFTEIDLLKKYLDSLIILVQKSTLTNKEVFLYDLKRVQMINSVSSMEDLIKRVIKILYNKGTLEEKKEIYKEIAPIAKYTKVFIFPPIVFKVYEDILEFIVMMRVLITGKEEKSAPKIKKIKIKKITTQSVMPENKIFINKNILILLKKKYRSSWLDIFRAEGSYFYFYSLLRQNKILFMVRVIQEYIGKISLHVVCIFILGVIIVGGLKTPEILYFNGSILIIMITIFLSLVFFFKEI